mmetsp:Transcript_27676/g.43195  ORF Transcript_27676/g.43195 Transcript_27676/m.43195 type:complete len:116 (-) Transcript_27676:954-1301(-)
MIQDVLDLKAIEPENSSKFSAPSPTESRRDWESPPRCCEAILVFRASGSICDQHAESRFVSLTDSRIQPPFGVLWILGRISVRSSGSTTYRVERLRFVGLLNPPDTSMRQVPDPI